MSGLAASPSETWGDLCARCHGPNGDGRTPTGLKLKAKDYTDPKVQQAFTDAGLLKNLLLGVGVDENPARMPAYKDKLTVAEAKELVALIRTFKK
jgi:mono/diheme cytochrome c family protein